MKLHLPKALLTMVLAVCVAQTVQAGWNGDTYYIDIVETPSLSTVGQNSGSNGFFVHTNNQQEFKTSTVTLLELGSGHTLNIDGSWNDASKEFELLTLESVKVSEGVGTLAVSGGNKVSVGNVTGVINVTAQGSINFTGSSSIGTLGMKDNGVVNFTGGTHTVEKMDIHNNNPSAGSNETLTISGATVKITGSDITDDNGVEDIYGGSTGTAAVTIGHWNNGGGKIVVGGETASASLFDVSGATIRMSWDSGSTLEINENGTVNAKRIQFANDNGDNAVVTLAGGRLNLGEGGVSANSHNNTYTGSSKREINLNSGTLGALAGTVNITAGTTNIGGVVTIDTAVVNAEGEKTGETANISFSSNVVLSSAADLTITGGGGVSFNALTLNSSKINIDEYNTVTLNEDCTFSVSGQVTGAGTLEIGDGANVVLGSDEGKAFVRSAIKVTGGAKLTAGDGDSLGWGSTATKSITLVGESDAKKAVFELTGRQTMSTAITMQGNALITGGSLESFGTLLSGDNSRNEVNTITVTGLNNKIESALFVRSHLTIAVTNATDVLEVSGDIGCRSDSDAKGRFTKSGAGTLTLSGTNNFVNTGDNSFLTTGGKTIITGDTTVAGSLGMGQGGSIDFTNGEHSIAKLDIHNGTNSATTETLTISGATVKITGEDGNITGNAANAAAVTLGHWKNGTAKVIVGGDAEKTSLFDVSGATIRMSWDSNSVLEIKENGTVNTKGVQFAALGGKSAVVNLSGGRLNLGGGGISGILHDNSNGGTREINLNSGTLGALAETVNITAGTTNIGGAVTIDTAIVNAKGEMTGNTANISFSNNVVLSDAAAFTIKGGGVVSINALDVKNTLMFDIQDETELNVESVSLSVQDGVIQLDDAKIYTDNSEGSFTANGFKKGAYRLFDGYEWSLSDTIDAYTVVTHEGDTLLMDGSVGTTFYVNEGTHTISTAGDYINGRVQSFYVAKDADLVIDAATEGLTAAQILTGTTGEGDITVSTDVELTPGNSTQAIGNLTVQNAKITLDTTGKHDEIKLEETSMASFSSVTLDNATIEYVGASTSLNNVTVTANGASLKFRDMADANSVYSLEGTTTLNGNLTVGRMDGNQAWKYTLNIEALTGTGDLSFTSAHETGKLNISSMLGYTGAITVTKGEDGAATLNATTGGAVNLKGITLSGGATGWIKIFNTITDYTSSLGAVSLSGGSELSVWNISDDANKKPGTTNISSLTVSGNATLGIYRAGSSFQGTVNIESLTSVEENASLTIKNGAQANAVSAFNLNGGTFVGVLNLEADSSKGGYETAQTRELHVNLNSKELAKDAVINFKDSSTDTAVDATSNYITLGVGVDGAKVAGLTGTTTNAATVKATEGTKSLEIIAAADKTYETNAKVESSVNLVKSGKGKQTISGTVASSSITVNAGELALTGVASLNLTTLDLQGGTLSLGAEGNVGEIVISKPTTGSVVANMSANTVLNGHLSLNEGVALSLSGWGDNAADINGKLTLGNGAHLQATAELMEEIKSLELDSSPLLLLEYDSFQLGNTEFAELSVAADAIVKATPLLGSIVDANTYFSSLNVGDYELIFTQSALYIQASNPIPEPTTATLSLLALAALASRRRRK